MELNSQQSILVVIGLFIFLFWILRALGPNSKAMIRTFELLQRQSLKRNGTIDQSLKRSLTLTYPFEGHEVNVHLIGSYRHRHLSTPPMTSITCALLSPIKYTLSIYKEDAFTRGEKLFGAKDIQIGHENFDKEFIIKGDDKNYVQSFLDISLQQRLLTLKQYEPELILSNNSFCLSYVVIPADAALFDQIIESAEAFIKKLQFISYSNY